jgi:hypothetical protein
MVFMLPSIQIVNHWMMPLLHAHTKHSTTDILRVRNLKMLLYTFESYKSVQISHPLVTL